MQNKKIIYSAIAIITVVVIGIAVYMQNSGELFQGSLIQGIQKTPTVSQTANKELTTTGEIEQRIMKLEMQTDDVEQKLMQLETKTSQLTLVTNDNLNKIEFNVNKQNAIINYMQGYMIDDLCNKFEHNFADNNSCYMWLTENLPTKTN